MATLTSFYASIHLTHALPPLQKTPNSNGLFNLQLNKIRKPFLSSSFSAPAVGFGAPQALSAKTSEVLNAVSEGKIKTDPIVVIDNYDSFTYNLCQYIGELGFEFVVYRNDELTLDELKRKNPRGILISPGPGAPQDSGISLQTVLELGPTVPLFGVCMGLQCIGEAFGGKIVRSPYGVMHGKSSLVYYNEGDQEGLFSEKGEKVVDGEFNGYDILQVCSQHLNITVPEKYHSLVIEKESFPADVLEITAWTEDGLIMAARHKTYKYLQGVQFHPESIITTEGKKIVHNFIKMIERKEAECTN